MTQLPKYLTAYGTLKESYNRWCMLGMQNCKVVGTAVVKGDLYDLGSYPALVDGDRNIEVEVIELIGDLPSIHKSLDWYEGVESGLYNKRTVEVEVAGTPLVCAAYYFGRQIPINAPRIEKF